MIKKDDRGFRYQKRTKDDLKERANMKGGNFDTYIKPKFKQWKPKDGKNLIRILPPTWDDARHYGLDIFVNFNIGPDNQSYLSLSKHDRGPDPLEEAKREAQREGDKDFAKTLTPNQRILYWIIDRNDEDEGPLLWAAPFTFDKSLSNLCIDEDTKDVIFIDDPAKGRDVRFYKEGTGLTTKYDPSKMKVLSETPIAEDEGLEQDWLDFIQDNPLPEVLNFYDYDHIKATFDGQAGRKDEDEEPRDPTAKRSVRNSTAPDKAVHRGANNHAQDDNEAGNGSVRRKRPLDDGEVPERPNPRARTRVVHEDQDEDASDEAVEAVARNFSRRLKAGNNEDAPNPPLRSRRGKTEDPDEGGDEGNEPSGSLRERLARRRSRTQASDEDDD
jgi:hypothetical protein